MVQISVAVEGDLDEAVARRLLRETGAQAYAVYGKQGVDWLRKKIIGFNKAASHSPWFVLTDLDQRECAPGMRREWLPEKAPYLCFRIAVREVEAWILADRERASRFLGVSKQLLPLASDDESDPKQALVNLARRSRRREIREGIAPREGSGRIVGPEYVIALSEFVSNTIEGWRPRVAAQGSPSLRSAIQCLENLIRTYRGT